MHFLVSFLLVFLLSPVCLAQDGISSNNSPSFTFEAKTVQIVLNDEHRQGVDWEAIVSDFHSLQLKKESDVAWFDKKYTLSVGQVSKDDYAVLLDALDTVGHLSQNDFSAITLHKDETASMEASPNPKGLPTIHLDLIWYNSPSGEAKLKITPSIGVMLRDPNAPNAITLLKNQTELNLKDNTTIVLGGLMQEEEITKTHKFPVLGNLPIVGLVFRKQGKLMHKTETIVFLTVHTNFIPTGEQK